MTGSSVLSGKSTFLLTTFNELTPSFFFRLSEKAHIPTKGSPLSAGYDLYSAADLVSVPQALKDFSGQQFPYDSGG